MLLPLDEVPVHVPLRRPRPLRFERLPVPVWNPYSRGRLSPAKSEDRKGGEGKTDANLTIFFSTCCAWHPNSPPGPGEAPHPAPSARKSGTRTAQKTALCAPCEHNLQAPLFSGTWSARTRPELTQGSWVDLWADIPG